MKTEKIWLSKIKLFVKNNSAFVIFAVLFIFAAFNYEQFFSYSFLMNLLAQNTMIGFLAIGMTFVVIAGDIDLSVGSIMAICGIFAAMLSPKNVVLVIVVVVAIGIALGCINGLLVAKLNIVPFIATLAMMIGLRGAVHIITHSKSVPTPDRTDAFKAIGNGELIPYVPNIVLIYILVFIVALCVLKYTRYGRYNYAVGGNRDAARMMGINVTRVQIKNYAISGGLCAIAAIVMTSRLGSGQYSAGDGWEMDAIASTVIGGTLLTGGKGGVKGTFFGVLILGIMKQIFNLQGNLNSWWQNIATGVILLAVVIAQSRADRKKDN